MWTKDTRAIFYVTKDDLDRPYKVRAFLQPLTHACFQMGMWLTVCSLHRGRNSSNG